jgi:hypothetical protein
MITADPGGVARLNELEADVVSAPEFSRLQDSDKPVQEWRGRP